jgi:membrane protease YdiL (CAAX protease family)
VSPTIFRQKGVAPSVGLVVAWGGTAFLVSPAAGFFGNPASIVTKCLEQIALWLLFAAIVGIVVFWEKQPLASLWVRPLQWQSVAWGGLLFLASILFLFPATEWVRSALGLAGYEPGMDKALAFPIWFRVIAVVTAGIVEETLFRGYAVTRLARLTGSLWLAAALSATVFAALHLPVWGAGPSLAFLIGSAATTGFFIWRRDLLAMIIAHVAIDAWGLVVTPLYSEWWR